MPRASQKMLASSLSLGTRSTPGDGRRLIRSRSMSKSRQAEVPGTRSLWWLN